MAVRSISLLFLLVLSHFLHKTQVLGLPSRSHDHDFSYMKIVKNATEFPIKREYNYDYIVIGGGTTGCPLAATLSQNYSVLVLERGQVPQAHPSVLNLSGFFSIVTQNNNNENSSPAQRFTSQDGVANLRGRVLGGSSRINAGFYSRAESEFFEKSGLEWDMDSVKRAYEWVEESLVSRPRLREWQSAVKEALLEAGVRPDNGFTLNHEVGTKVSGSIFDDVSRRHGADELLSRGNLKNLRVVVGATVERIVFSTKESKNPSAIGVIYTDSNGKSHSAFVRKKGEIILSAGAIGSPQLLLLSGIGPHSNLSSLKIPILFHQPNVGKFMFDNPRTAIRLKIPFPIELSPVQVVGITKDYYIQATSFSTNLQSFGTIAEKIPGPLSSGSLWLSEPLNEKATPRVRFNYFADPKDLSRCVSATRRLGQMLTTRAMDRFKYKNSNGVRDFLFNGTSLPMNLSDDSTMKAFCRATVSTIYHFHGGCVVGKVINGKFRVLGTKALRVVDASTFSMTPGTNPQATLMMLGRYVGLKMLRERREA